LKNVCRLTFFPHPWVYGCSPPPTPHVFPIVDWRGTNSLSGMPGGSPGFPPLSTNPFVSSPPPGFPPLPKPVKRSGSFPPFVALRYSPRVPPGPRFRGSHEHWCLPKGLSFLAGVVVCEQSPYCYDVSWVMATPSFASQGLDLFLSWPPRFLLFQIRGKPCPCRRAGPIFSFRFFVPNPQPLLFRFLLGLVPAPPPHHLSPKPKTSPRSLTPQPQYRPGCVVGLSPPF